MWPFEIAYHFIFSYLNPFNFLSENHLMIRMDLLVYIYTVLFFLICPIISPFVLCNKVRFAWTLLQQQVHEELFSIQNQLVRLIKICITESSLNEESLFTKSTPFNYFWDSNLKFLTCLIWKNDIHLAIHYSDLVMLV